MAGPAGSWTSLKHYLAGPTGFEPAIFSVTGRRDRPLHYGPIRQGFNFYSIVNGARPDIVLRTPSYGTRNALK